MNDPRNSCDSLVISNDCISYSLQITPRSRPGVLFIPNLALAGKRYILKGMANPNLAAKIEAILFFKNEPVSRQQLAKWLTVSPQDIETGLETLAADLENRGLTLVYKDDSVALGTKPQLAQLIEDLTKEELTKDLGRAGLETIAIILYWGPISRADIDYIRGVNSSFILRHLLVRGLVERITNPDNARSFLYRPTFDLLGHLGIEQVADLPEYQEITQALAKFKHQTDEADQTGTN